MVPIADQVTSEIKNQLASRLGSLELEQVWSYKNVYGDAAVGAHADFLEN